MPPKTNKYTILFEASFDAAQMQAAAQKVAKKVKVVINVQLAVNQQHLQEMLDKAAGNVKKQPTIKARIVVDQKDRDNMITRWKNKIEKMKITMPDIVNAPKVQAELKTLESMFQNFAQTGTGVDDIRTQFSNLDKEVVRAREGMRIHSSDQKSWIDNLRIAFKRLLQYATISGVIYGGITAIRDMIQNVKELDTALVELRKVTDLSGNSLKEFTKEAFASGEEIGRTGTEMIQAVTEFARAGYDLDESKFLGKYALVMTNVAEGIDTATEASSVLISVLRGYNLEASEAARITDIINEVSNVTATNFDELADGLRRTSGVLAQTGTGVEQLTGLLVGGFESLRDMEMVSSGLVMISQRLRGMEEDGEAIDGLSAKLQKDFKEIAGIDIQDANGQLRSTYDILSDMAKVFPTLTTQERQYLGELAAGNRQVKVLTAILNNWENVEKSVTAAGEATGSAMRENEKFLDSIQGKLNAFESAWQSLSSSIVGSEVVKLIVGVGTAILKAIDHIGAFNVISVAVAAGIASRTPGMIGSLGMFFATTIEGFGASTAAAITFGTVLETVLGTVAVLSVIALGTAIYKQLNPSMAELNGLMLESKSHMTEESSSIASLAEEYRNLGEKSSKTEDDRRRLWEIQNILNDQYDASVNGINSYSDAIENNSKKIEENYFWIKTLTKAQQDKFLQENKSRYLYSKGYLEEKDFSGELMFANGEKAYAESMGYLDDQILTAEEYLSVVEHTYQTIGYMQPFAEKGLKYIEKLREEIDAAKNSVYEYESVLGKGSEWGGHQSVAQKQGAAWLPPIEEITFELSASLGKIYEGMDSSKAKDFFESFTVSILNAKKALDEGRISVEEYIKTVNEGFTKEDFSLLAGMDIESAQKTFESMSLFAAQTMSDISKNFDDGKITLDQYSDSLLALGDTFSNLSGMAAILGVDVSNHLGVIEDGERQLRNLHDVNMLIEQDKGRLESGSMMFGDETYAARMRELADAAIASGVQFKNLNGDVMGSADAIYNYLMASEDGFSSFSKQAASQLSAVLNQINHSVGQMLVDLGTAINNIDATIKFTPTGDLSKLVPALMNQMLGGDMNLPEFALRISGGGLGQPLIDYGKKLMESNVAFDESVFTVDKTSDAYDTLTDSIKASDAALQSNIDATREAEEAYQKLLDLTIKMLRQKKEAEKEALQEELDGYKKIIDARKEMIDRRKDERDYKKKTKEINKDISGILDELEELKFDTSEEGRKRRLELEEELAKLQSDLDDERYNRSVELQKQALDDEYKRFEEQINAKIAEIERYLSESGTITREAMALIEAGTASFYQELLEWNRIYGTGIDSDVVGGWNRAKDALGGYVNASAGAIASAGLMYDLARKTKEEWIELYNLGSGIFGDGGVYTGGGGSGGGEKKGEVMHTGGIVGGIGNGMGEVFTKLMRGEFVATQDMMNSFIKRTLPAMISGGGGMNINMPISVAGSLDESVLPKLKDMVSKSIYSAMRDRGNFRNANSFSV